MSKQKEQAAPASKPPTATYKVAEGKNTRGLNDSAVVAQGGTVSAPADAPESAPVVAQES